ncbi:MAG: sigma-54 dependent transcriptional regulator [Deltaproteobacteria bacterium]|jgi:two-component system response regulator HydG|nr:sigma-54 dependent transcriptional regulator [Deltaproteobacteria bacterium]
MSKVEILVVDDEKVALADLCALLAKEGSRITATRGDKQALSLLKQRSFAVVLTDLQMPLLDGLLLLKRIRLLSPKTQVIGLSSSSSVPFAIKALKAGAYHYFAHPLPLEEVQGVIRAAIAKFQLTSDLEQIQLQGPQPQLITHNREMKSLLEMTDQIADTDTNVVISGESGTGKELLARFIHRRSHRHTKTMLSINCGALSEELMTNELFGHRKGAFTGANEDKKGLVEMADGGTLFLDEITEMTPSMQVKLLRVLQEKEVLRVGSTRPIKVNVRFVAATNRDLKTEIGAGNFRQDLFFRINVVSLKIPPLSERKDDIPLLIQFFLARYNLAMRKKVTEVEPEVIALLQGYDFPGNVRELENIIERGVALASGSTLAISHIPEDLRNTGMRIFRKKSSKYATLADMEKSYISWILKETDYNKTVAARALGIDRVSLWRKIKKLQLE